MIANHSGARTAEAFEATLGKAHEFQGLQAKAAGGDEEAIADLFQMQVKMGHFKPDEARKKMEAVKTLTPEVKAELEQLIVNQEVQAAFSIAKSPADLPKVGKELAKMSKAGKVTTDPNLVANYWFAIAKHAEAEKDPQLMEEAIEKLKGETGRNPRLRTSITQLEEALEKLKG